MRGVSHLLNLYSYADRKKTRFLFSLNLQDIDASLFNQLSKLEDLDLSKNRILSFPSGVILPALKKLDLSDNTISQLDFLKNFPNLETVLLAANPLQENDKYLAVYLLPKVRGP